MEDEKVRETSKSDEVREVEEQRLEPTGTDAVVASDDDDKEENDDQSKVQPDNPLDFDTKQLTDQDRLVLYEKAVRLKRKGNTRHALQCFLCCLQGLKERAHFSVLPECLHHIAEIYSAEDDYETAIQFAQAEKLYYETALITVNKDEKPEPSEDQTTDVINDSNVDNSSSRQTQHSTRATSEEAQKAEEYEKLAHMCLKQQNPQLALDYCAKAVKLQQSCYGEQHPITLQTLDLFTVIYAEMGKQQYKAAMEKFSAAQEKEKQAKQLQDEAQEKDDKEKQAKQLQDKAQEKDDKEKQAKQLQDEAQEKDESEHQNSDQPGGVDGDEKTHSDDQNQPDSSIPDTPTTEDTVQVTVTSSCALVLYFIITVLLALVLTATLCYVTQTDIHTTYNYVITRSKFYYYYYFVKKQPDGYKYY